MTANLQDSKVWKRLLFSILYAVVVSIVSAMLIKVAREELKGGGDGGGMTGDGASGGDEGGGGEGGGGDGGNGGQTNPLHSEAYDQAAEFAAEKAALMRCLLQTLRANVFRNM